MRESRVFGSNSHTVRDLPWRSYEQSDRRKFVGHTTLIASIVRQTAVFASLSCTFVRPFNCTTRHRRLAFPSPVTVGPRELGVKLPMNPPDSLPGPFARENRITARTSRPANRIISFRGAENLTTDGTLFRPAGVQTRANGPYFSNTTRARTILHPRGRSVWFRDG